MAPSWLETGDWWRCGVVTPSGPVISQDEGVPDLPPPLAALVARAGDLAGAGPSRARQLRWVAGELARHVSERREPPPRTPTGWCDPALLADYLTAADAGRLRSRGAPDRPSPDATRRVRHACLRLLARAAGTELPGPVGVPAPRPRPRVEPVPAAIALSHWAGRALPATAPPGRVRAAAMAALTHEAALRSGELAALRVEDLDLAARTVTYRPRPPAARGAAEPVTVPLSPATCRLLAHWTEVRDELVAATPRTRTLWVSLRANHDGTGVRRPPGLPLEPGGLRRAHARAVAEANAALAGTPGYEPLPRAAGLLRGAPRGDPGPPGDPD